ncbi:MAG: hypothetical protein ABSD63_06395 [Candidatus Korobacteraceae bacterium]
MTLVLLMAVGAASQQSPRPKTTSARSISRDEAANLLRTFLKSEGYDTKAAPVDIEDSADSPDSGFYLLAVFVDTPQRLVKIGNYGVNGRTGDLWNLVECKRITSSAIALKQKQIRESSGLSSTDVKRLRNSVPCF